MSEVKTVATRAAFGSALVELGAERDDFIVMDADLAAATQTGMFKKAYPDRFYDCGIAEANMIGKSTKGAKRSRMAFSNSRITLSLLFSTRSHLLTTTTSPF